MNEHITVAAGPPDYGQRDIAAIEARHRPVLRGSTVQRECIECVCAWPCDTEVMRRERDRMKAERDDVWRRALAARERYEHAEEDAIGLYEALRAMYGIHHKALAPSDRCRDDTLAALAAHEALTGEKP